MITVACVKVRPGYNADYVNRLYHMVERHLTVPHEFVCLTDDPEGIECKTIVIEDAPRGWWAKLLLFNPEIFKERVLFFDLDTIILENIDFMAGYSGSFAVLRDFYVPPGYGSAIMSIEPYFAPNVWYDFQTNANAIMQSCHGDQDWIKRNVYEVDRWQSLFPGRIVSYKVHCLEGVPEGAAVVCFHGEPKPHEVNEDWVKSNWL